MSVNRYDQVEIFKYLKNVFTGNVCEQVYEINPPKSLSEKDDVYLVVSMPRYLEDREAYSKVFVLTELFVKSKSRGQLPAEKFQELASRLNSVINEYSKADTRPYIFMPTRFMGVTSYNAKTEYHVYIYSFNLFITGQT